jgi:hypothetical protein
MYIFHAHRLRTQIPVLDLFLQKEGVIWTGQLDTGKLARNTVKYSTASLPRLSYRNIAIAFFRAAGDIYA